MTAPPSPLLTEVVAAYDAAYADLIAAELAMDENFPALDDHIADGQLDQWREVIRGLKADGDTVRIAPAVTAWSRIESMSTPTPDRVVLEACREDNTEKVQGDGTPTGADGRPYRYLETMDRIEGRWMWVGREWIDSSASSPDCASPPA